MKEVLKNCQYFKIYKQNKVHAQASWAWKKFYNLGASLWLIRRSLHIDEIHTNKLHTYIKVHCDLYLHGIT